MLILSAALLLLLSLATLLPLVSSGTVAVLVHGESFRAHGQQNSREVGEAGLEPQKAAVLAQLTFIFHPLVFDAGYSAVEVHVLTYATGMEDNLRRWYGPLLKNLSLATQPEGGAAHEQPGGTNDAAIRLLEGDYDAVMLMRMDVFPKPPFAGALLAADRSKLLFTMQCGPEMVGGLFIPRVADMWVWIPRSLFAVAHERQIKASLAQLEHTLINSHHAYQVVENHFPGGLASMSYLQPQPTKVDSDPKKERNRLYRLSGRDEMDRWNGNVHDTPMPHVRHTLELILSNEDDTTRPYNVQNESCSRLTAQMC